MFGPRDEKSAITGAITPDCCTPGPKLAVAPGVDVTYALIAGYVAATT